MQPELKTKELKKKVVITVITVLKTFQAFSLKVVLYLVILGTVSKEKLLYPKQKSTRGGVWLQEM